MQRSFLYFFILLLIFLLCSKLFVFNNKYAPKKIRLFTNIMLSLVCIQSVSLLIISILEKQNFIIYFKGFLYLDFIFVPLIIWTCTYIYLRNYKLDFNLSYIVLLITVFIYGVLIMILPERVRISDFMGYSIDFNNNIFHFVYCILIISIILICCFMFKNKFVNKDGIVLVMFVCSIILIERMLFIYKINIFPQGIIGSLISICLINYVYISFKDK